MSRNFLFSILIALAFFYTLSLVFGYSTYGAPTEFGNATNTTCWIGGDDGILNCTGDAYFGGTITGTVNDSTHWGGYSTSDEWISPTQILDVDKEDIETDLNTFVDIAGDIMTGNLDSSANISASNFSAGLSEGDSFIYFFDDGISTGEHIKWDDDADRFEVTNSFYVSENIVSSLDISAGGYLRSQSSIYTASSAGYFWLGTVNQSISDFKAYPDGRLNITNNITLTSPDGSYWNCGVANDGTFSCTGWGY